MILSLKFFFLKEQKKKRKAYICDMYHLHFRSVLNPWDVDSRYIDNRVTVGICPISLVPAKTAALKELWTIYAIVRLHKKVDIAVIAFKITKVVGHQQLKRISHFS